MQQAISYVVAVVLLTALTTSSATAAGKLKDLNCPAGDIIRSDGQGGYECSTDIDTDTDTLGALSDVCTDGQVAKRDATGTWVCGDDNDTNTDLRNELCGLYQLTGNPAPSTLISESPEVTCDDGLDNDCDGAVDLADSDCTPVEICDDGVDNNGNRLIDCEEPSCQVTPACGCIPDEFESNDTGTEASDLGTLTDTAGGGGGNQEFGEFCIGSGSQYILYSRSTNLDVLNDSANIFFQVVRDPFAPPSCDSYTLNVSMGPVGATTTVELTGNIVPEGDSDWYRFFAEDIPEGQTELDSFRVNIEFISNPANQFRIGAVFVGSVTPDDRRCLGAF